MHCNGPKGESYLPTVKPRLRSDHFLARRSYGTTGTPVTLNLPLSLVHRLIGRDQPFADCRSPAAKMAPLETATNRLMDSSGKDLRKIL
jgi:hypothetical protein